MKILHINCNYIGTTLHQIMIENLEERGINNTVFVPTYDKKISVIQPNDNVCVSECFNRRDRVFFDYKQVKIRKALEAIIRVNKYDVIHAYTLFTDGNCARKLSKKYGIPYVVAVRNTDVNDFFRLMPHLRNRGIKIMKDASAVFFLSEVYKKQVFEKYIPQNLWTEFENKVKVIPNGIDKFWLDDIPLNNKKINKDENINLIYAGKIDKNKNIRTTQAAMEILSKKGYKVSLTIVGKIIDKDEFGKIKKDKHTLYVPPKTKEMLRELYRENDIFIMPSIKETFGLVYAEAMSQGLPVVYSRGQGFDGQFPEGLVGFSVKSLDAYEIAEKLEEIIGNYECLTAACKKNVEKFNWKNIVRVYEREYQNCLSGNK